MAKRGRGRPKGSLNKKTLEKQKKVDIGDQMAAAQEMIEQLDESSNGIKEEDFGYDGNGSPVIEPIEKGSTKEKVLKGPDKVEEPKKSSAPKKWTADTLPRNPSVVEILKGVNSLRGKKDQVAQLSKFTERADVVYCLKAAFDDRVVFTLPEGLPDNFVIGDPDTPAGAMDMAPERLIRVYKRMQYWVEGGRSQAKPAKREEIFLDTLRSLEKSEAEFLNEIRQKKMPFKNITKEVCEEAGFDLTPK